jgi:hypothetical protein
VARQVVRRRRRAPPLTPRRTPSPDGDALAHPADSLARGRIRGHSLLPSGFTVTTSLRNVVYAWCTVNLSQTHYPADHGQLNDKSRYIAKVTPGRSTR